MTPAAPIPRATGGPVFVKLGGALITDKSGRASAREAVIARLAHELAQARADLDGPLVVAHGSGSFAHVAVVETGFAARPDDMAAWVLVAAAARRLDALVVDALLAAGLPAWPVPAASVLRMTPEGLRWALPDLLPEALHRGLVPVLYGDVVWHAAGGGAVASTEELLAAAAEVVRPARIVLATDVAGVLAPGPDGALDIVATIEVAPDGEHVAAPPLVADARAKPGTTTDVSRGAAEPGSVTDVTGAMAGKVAVMARLVAAHPTVDVRICSGATPGLVAEHLLGLPGARGTRIVARARDGQTDPQRVARP